MKVLPSFQLTFFCLCAIVMLADAANKIKVTDIDTPYLNEQYINAKEVDIRLEKVNNTYNKVEIKFENLKDYPANDTKLDIAVLRSTKSSTGPWEELLGKYRSYICDPKDKLRQYLPAVFNQQTDKGKCLTKGKLDIKDAGIFKFCELVPEEKLKKSYFLIINRVSVGETPTILCNVRAESTDM